MKLTTQRTMFFAALVSVLAASGWGAPIILDRNAAVELALENNPDFQIAAISLESVERENRNSWNSFLPGISAGIRLNGSSSLLDSQPKTMSWKASANLDLSLPINASIGYTIKGLQLAYESQKISYETARLGLISSVEKEFFYLLAAEENLAIQEANIRLAKERHNQTRINYENGLASELEMLQAEVSAANLEPSYLQTVADYKARIREFLIILGIDPSTEIELQGSLDTPVFQLDAEDLIERYLARRGDLLALQKELETLENDKRDTVATRRIPSLGISTGWDTDVSNPFTTTSWDYDRWTDGLSLSLSLSIPLDGLIPGSSDTMTIDSEKADIDKADISLVKATAEARTEILNLVAQLETTASNMKLSELNVALAAKSFELTEESYKRGTVQRLDVEDAQQSYLEAVQQSLTSQYEYLSGLIDLRDALGLESLDELI